MNQVWYVRRGVAISGPFPGWLISHYRRRGCLRSDDELSNDLNFWRRVSDVTEALEPRAALPRAVRYPAPRVGDATSASGPRAAPLAARYLRLLRRPSEHRALPLIVLVAALFAFGAASFLGSDRAPPEKARCGAPPAPGIDWQGCALDGLAAKHANLEGAGLRNARLHNAHLFAARLRRADLAYADLSGADLSYADLGQADLTGANLRGADLSYSNLRGANLSYTALPGASLASASLTGAVLGHALWFDGRECPATAIGGCR